MFYTIFKSNFFFFFSTRVNSPEVRFTFNHSQRGAAAGRRILNIALLVVTLTIARTVCILTTTNICTEIVNADTILRGAGKWNGENTHVKNKNTHVLCVCVCVKLNG